MKHFHWLAIALSLPNHCAIHVAALCSSDISRAQAFYRSVGYSVPISPTDTTVIALNENNQIVGIGRLAHENQALVLRGMQVSPAFQRQGVGQELLDTLQAFIGPDLCWCIPHAHLEKFYNKVGFKRVDETQAPAFLQERIRQTRTKYPDVIMMAKNLPE